MKYYYQYQFGKFLEGDDEYLSRFHRDYEPCDTKQEALDACRSFFQGEYESYLEIANRKARHRDAVPLSV